MAEQGEHERDHQQEEQELRDRNAPADGEQQEQQNEQPDHRLTSIRCHGARTPSHGFRIATCVRVSKPHDGVVAMSIDP